MFMLRSTPMRIHINPSTKPVAVITAATIPLNLREQVKTQDMAPGTIESANRDTSKVAGKNACSRSLMDLQDAQ